MPQNMTELVLTINAVAGFSETAKAAEKAVIMTYLETRFLPIILGVGSEPWPAERVRKTLLDLLATCVKE